MPKEHIVEIDGLPVDVDPVRWAEDEAGYAQEIRDARAEQRLTGDPDTVAPSYNDLVGD